MDLAEYNYLCKVNGFFLYKLPNCWSTSQQNDSLRKENYRLVSILISLSKIFEKIMDNQLSELKARVFSYVLSAFRTGYSAEYVMMNIVEKWKSALDTSKSSDTLLMDLSKAFNSIPHDLLLANLKAYVIEGGSLTLITSYLRNRKQCVNICSYCSEWLPLSKDVPQGSISGPSIF